MPEDVRPTVQTMIDKLDNEILTDEIGFATVNRLQGVSVCIGTKTDSAARYQVESVAEFFAWLDHAASLLAPIGPPTRRTGVTA